MVGGKCTIGAGCIVGACAVLKPGITIGAGAVVKEGSSVLKDVPAGTTHHRYLHSSMPPSPEGQATAAASPRNFGPILAGSCVQL